ncbi:leucyl/phenylalanyl-tRNA--protein transferase [Filimonas zeae]|uniref:Leucyl/phenylalanyl-tRNA--protein transferase n=1 Tax=Filimonas zeae TaxID=1737353 RepID=A0A917IMU1_9BACT|nr:leucyl/phenylalanyl-tRNA--protein transferase [Filimonas zeae]MDR6337524.1 leucyl/phenylalanyl-tRNA--protein transferase [Filimonas zeae]GGH59022.1 leucyl/phenylalanyl-tRNA--protein transferase [Filimonas zeae]
MPLHVLDENLWFPPVEDAMDDGLMAVGGDLSEERILLAYRRGIFPWYEGDVPLWWCPDPRFVLLPQQLNISKSMKVLLKRQAFRFTINQAFPQVIRHCKTVKREDQLGTWITDDVESSYIHLHERGFAHSAEAWLGDKLVGGLYGIRLGKVFFGESMFSLVSNASKYAFISYVQQLIKEEVQLIDCQVYTPHLESLGAGMIPRSAFIEALDALIS